MLSMTGFGHAERSFEGFDIAVDVKTVNSRYFDFKPKLPRELNGFESDLRELSQKYVTRGRVDLSVELRVRNAHQLQLDESLLESYLHLAEVLAQKGVQGGMTVQNLLAVPGMVVTRTSGELPGSLQESLAAVAEEALQMLLESRQREGLSLQVELKQRLELFSKAVFHIGGAADRIAEHYREKLTRRVTELWQGPEIDEARLAQEIIYYVEKADVTEELARLRSHIGQFQEQLELVDGVSVGKKLDFLCQELNREVNTILSKASVVEISELGIEAKAEIEKIREQVQNVE